MCVYIHRHVYMYRYIDTYIHTHIHTHTYTHTYVYLPDPYPRLAVQIIIMQPHVHILAFFSRQICATLQTWKYDIIHVCICMYVYVNIHTQTHMHTHTHKCGEKLTLVYACEHVRVKKTYTYKSHIHTKLLHPWMHLQRQKTHICTCMQTCTCTEYIHIQVLHL